MSLINPIILYGLGLAVIPILLHFLLKSKPKKLIFPALMLLKMRQANNSRRMRLKHFWLLLLRVLVIMLLVLAIARPSLPAANYTPNLFESLSLLAIVAIAVAAYWSVLQFWKKQQIAHHVLSYRKSVLRGCTGGGMFLLFLLMFAWPYQRRISAEIVAPLSEVIQDIKVSGVFVFDSSLSMDYRYENKTRLDIAKEIANTQLGRFPQGSRIAVTDTASDDPILYQADLSGAQARIDALEVSPINLRLNERVRAALSLQEDDRKRTLNGQESLPEEKWNDRFLREIYIFTDLSHSGWQTRGSTFLRDEISRLEWCQIYIIDVGVDDPTNIGITDLDLSRQTVPLGSELVVTASIAATGLEAESEQSIELFVEDKGGELVRQAQQTLTLETGTETRATFLVTGLDSPTGRGELRLISSDPYSADDVRYFTIAVREPPQILLVSDKPENAVYLRYALSPPQLEGERKNIHHCTVIRSSQLQETDLTPFEVVCLINVRRPSEDDWIALASYVNAGGGLAVFLGMRNGNVNPVAAAYGSEVAQAFLPAQLLADLSFSPAETLDLRNRVHPMLVNVERDGGLPELTSSEIRRYWRVEAAANANVIAEFTDSQQSPALLERSYGKGRTVMLTTAVDLRGWSDLPRTWAFLAFSHEMMHYLGGRSKNIFNYSAGEDIVLPIDRNRSTNEYLYRKPGLQQTRIESKPGSNTLTLNDADEIGQYRLSPSQSDSPFEMGFCVNTPNEESDFTPIEIDKLDQLLGADRYTISKNVDDLRTNVSAGRIGKEVFSLVLLVMITLFCTEHIVANRFYEADQTVDHT